MNKPFPFHATEQDISEMVSRIVEAVHPEQVILFGSYAKGNEGPDSDVDLLVIERQITSRRAEFKKIWQALRGILIPKDILVYSAQEIEKWKTTPSHVIGNALQHGKVMYERF